MAFVFPLSIFMSYHGPSKNLTKNLPPFSMIRSVSIILSLFGQIFIGIIACIIPLLLVKYDPQYQDINTSDHLDVPYWENTLLLYTQCTLFFIT